MAFIGIVANSDDYEFIKKVLEKNIDCSKHQIINLNENSIENMRNIKFETIAICEDIQKIYNRDIIFEKFFNDARYLIINTDINLNFDNIQNSRLQIITYGMNQKATVTASSIEDDEVLICVQRNMLNVDNRIIEMQEAKVRCDNVTNAMVYNLLVSFIINILYL